MGTCQCTNQGTQQIPDLNKMTLSKYSTLDNFYNHTHDTHKNSLGRSVMVSESLINSRLHKLTSLQDKRIDSRVVKSTYRDLPPTDASKYRDLMLPEQQIYINSLSAKYVGQLNDGQPHGYGKLYFDKGDFLEGTFIHGRCEGKGRFIKLDGSYYDGDFRNNVADGYGIYVGKKGFRYEGQWKNNVPNGSGQATYPDGSRYVGQFLNNKKNGKGTLYQEGNVYRGEFKSDNFHGKLIYEGQNGQYYEGQWINSKKSGYGVYKWPDGSSYKGQYLDDKRHGQGVMVYSNGQVYDGQWSQGNKHGKGKIRSQKQNFIGMWKNGNLVGIVSQ